MLCPVATLLPATTNSPGIPQSSREVGAAGWVVVTCCSSTSASASARKTRGSVPRKCFYQTAPPPSPGVSTTVPGGSAVPLLATTLPVLHVVGQHPVRLVAAWVHHLTPQPAVAAPRGCRRSRPARPASKYPADRLHVQPARVAGDGEKARMAPTAISQAYTGLSCLVS